MDDSWSVDRAAKWVLWRLALYALVAIGSGGLFVLGAYIYSLTL